MENGLIRLDDLHDSLKEPQYDTPQTTTLEVTRLNCLNKNLVSLVITGKTIVNLLGLAGDCEDVSLWSTYQSTLTLDNTKKVIGNNSIKVTINNTFGDSRVSIFKKIDFTKKYGVSVYAMNGNLSGNMNLIIEPLGTGTAITKSYLLDSTKFNKCIVKFDASSFTSATDLCITLRGNGASGQYFNHDAIMLEEITAEDYANPNWTPSPYVTNDSSVGETPARIKSVGKNRINLKSNKLYIGDKVILNGDTITIKGESGIDSLINFIDIPVKQNTNYTISAINNGYFNIWGQQIMALIITGVQGQTTTFNSGENTLIDLAFVNNKQAGVFTCTNLQLEEGSTATPYEPYQDTTIPIPYPLRSLPNGVADTQDTKKGKVYKRIEKLILDGSLNWAYLTTQTGYKQVTLMGNFKNAVESKGRILKFNNKNLSYVNAWNSADLFELNYGNLGNLVITVSSIDSGWGDGYQPNTDEIKAYFNGYQMGYLNGSTFTTPYNGTGTKVWRGIINDNGQGSVNLPTSMFQIGYTPYRLYYQLAQTQEIDLPAVDLVALPGGSLVVENDAQSWVRPKLDYVLNKNSRANLEDLMQEVVRNNTYKPLNGVYCTTKNLNYYVDANKGDDINNNGLSPDKPFRTIQKAIDSLPQVINHGVSINVANGTYNGDIILYGFLGYGFISLIGSSKTDCIITGTIYVRHTLCELSIKYFNLTLTTYHGIVCTGSTRVILNYLKLNGATTTYCGILCYYGILYCGYVEVSNKLRGINASIGGFITSDVNSGTGNTAALFADYGGTIAKAGSQPAGTTAETTQYGGVIR